jgi:hypothetical protein
MKEVSAEPTVFKLSAVNTKIGYMHYKVTQHNKLLFSLLINYCENDELVFSFIYHVPQNTKPPNATVMILHHKGQMHHFIFYTTE